MRRCSDSQLISMGLYPVKPVNIPVPSDMPSIVAGSYGHILDLLCSDDPVRGFDPVQVKISPHSPQELVGFISSMTASPRATLDRSDSQQPFTDIIPKGLDSSNFGRFFDNLISKVPCKVKSE